MLFTISMAKKLLEHFMKKNYKRLINKINPMSNGNFYDSSFNSCVDKKDLIK